ncbi:MAG: radical SAM family heme chaperone HemW [Acidobacteriota bacterium]
MFEKPEILELGLYVHIPFCVRKCFYCDFNSGPAGVEMRHEHLHALEQEIRKSSWRGQGGRTVFFGGGTPSELSIDELTALVDALCETFAITPGAEWTIECNPGTVNREALEAIRALGFNRISLGVQSFHDHHLKALGRIHDSGEALQAYRAARQAGFENINLDLIFALPHQDLLEWEADLSQALALAPEHLSLYNLTIEPNTEFGRRHSRGQLQEAGEDLSADMYELALDLTAEAGYGQYEISNFARPGYECAHNLIYWRNEPYLGFGVSAASYISGLRWSNTGNWHEYAAHAASESIPHATEERLHGQTALAEEIMLRLRTREGLSMNALSQKYNCEMPRLFADTLRFLTQEELLNNDGDRLTLSRRGQLLANEVCLQFLSHS